MAEEQEDLLPVPGVILDQAAGLYVAGAVEELVVNGPIVGVALAEGDRRVEDPLDGLLGLEKTCLPLLPLGPATVGLQDR